jgi:hypothetical protein
MPPLRLRENTNSFDLQYIYLGYQLPVKGLALCEIYAGGRNLLQSYKLTPEIGGLRYYGLGAKVAW